MNISRNMKAGLAAAIIIIGLINFVWFYMPLPNISGRPADGEKHAVFSDNIQHVYYERGKGPIVALLPSLGRPASDFNELTEALANAGFRTIAIDLDISRKPALKSNGNLFQLADRVDTIISALGLHEDEQIFVIGHAFGNRLARTYATSHSKRVQAVVLLAAGGQIPISKDVRLSLRDCFDPYITNIARSRALRHAFFAQESSIPSYWRVGWDKSLAEIQIHATQTTPYKDWWGSGSVPLLVIQGDKDTIAPATHTSKLLKAEYGDRIDVAIASPAGHALLPEKPDFIASTIIAYLTKVTAR